MNQTKQVTKFMEEDTPKEVKALVLTNEQLQHELDYFRSEKILNSMLKKGLISEVEFNKIMELNRKTFTPFLAEIMPINR